MQPASIPSFTVPSGSREAVSILARLILGLFAFLTALPATQADNSSGPASGFMPYVELAPFEVDGEQLAVSIHARSRSDRRYGAKFAEEVVGVAYQTMEKTTGFGLVIVGRKREPHPIRVYDQFLAMAEAGQLDPEVASLASGLTHMLQEWEAKADFNEGGGDGPNIDFDMVVNAIPLPLEGVGSKLYQMAWAEDFDPDRLERLFRSLTPEDFEADDLARFEWVFYLPPKSAFSEAMKQIVPTMLKESDLGFMQRMAVRTALTVFKPMLKRAVEGVRKGMLYLTVLRAMSGYSEGDIEALTEVYIESSMPFGGGSDYDTPLEAIEAQKIRNAEYAKDPFVSPEPLENADLVSFEKFEGGYSDNEEKVTHRFRVEGEACTWQYRDRDPKVFLPAGDALLVSENGEMTLEFLMDETGEVTTVEERWVRRTKQVPRWGGPG